MMLPHPVPCRSLLTNGLGIARSGWINHDALAGSVEGCRVARGRSLSPRGPQLSVYVLDHVRAWFLQDEAQTLPLEPGRTV